MREVSYAYNGTLRTLSVYKQVPPNGTWLAVVPCGANVTVVTSYGVATRAQTWTPVCIKREVVASEVNAEFIRELVEYADYVADYHLYKSVPVLAAFFRSGSFQVAVQT
ncbi:hypothetical protein [Pyrobaculum neutrophilum]|uniref:Uncharacterized protein n=1 Tax=Pyrobaculum neutrophilum (strain DSM 2338 / JCM 9278 / NBRC 100436 / V24Sta) TaxID=444157 RepID=B1YDW2_PYRNV|nr:hypothetical protein [Pyrobaculum neutrophilum]ACB39975.1 hypothetical protein Tneu_1044 [Pyrobaculum neutrophilum V24Sta]